MAVLLLNSRVADIDVYLFLLQLHRWLRTKCRSSARLLWMAWTWLTNSRIAHHPPHIGLPLPSILLKIPYLRPLCVKALCLLLYRLLSGKWRGHMCTSDEHSVLLAYSNVHHCERLSCTWDKSSICSWFITWTSLY